MREHGAAEVDDLPGSLRSVAPARLGNARRAVRVVDMAPGPFALMAGTANVIMQLSWPEVGYGVVESKVESGQVTRHPMKRARTTFTYLAVALMGSPEERAVYRKAVNGSHAAVRSGPDSPVQYNAFDPALQLWVGACLYQGTVDVAVRMNGPMDDATADAFYLAAAPLATSLQVRPESWPPDRRAFAEYWDRALERVSIDPAVRRYLHGLATLAFLPAPVRWVQGRFHLFVTKGFLPPRFRDAMGYEWTAQDQRRFDRMIRLLATVSRRLPPAVRRFPFNYYLWDFRVRVRFGRRLV